MWKPVLALSLAASMAAPTAKAAEPADAPPAPKLKFEAQLEKIDSKVSAQFGADKQKTLRQMAEASVLSDYCAAVDLDKEKFKDEFKALTMDGTQRKPAEQKDYEAKLAMYFGVYVGLLVAEGTERLPEFCGFAEDALKEKKPLSRFWAAAANSQKPNAP
jgi:hypothetical protein